MIVTITPAEEAIAHTLAVMRNAANRGGQISDKQMGGQDAIEIDRIGLVAEIAFGKRFNFYPDLTIVPRAGSADFIDRKGRKIDVKATKYKNGRLVVHRDKTLEDADFCTCWQWLMAGQSISLGTSMRSTC